MERREGKREHSFTPHTKRTGTAQRGTGSHLTATTEGEVTEGDEPGYNPSPEDLRLRKVYGHWIHVNPGTHLDGGISNDAAWQVWWRDLAVVPSKRYDAPNGRVGRRFAGMRWDKLRGVRERLWNLEPFIVFQTVILQQARHVTASHAIRRRIKNRLDAWREGKHAVLVEDTLRTCAE